MCDALRWAESTGMIAVNPLKHLKRPARESRGAKSVISENDHKRLCSFANPSLRLLLTLLWETGARPSEIEGLTAADVLGTATTPVPAVVATAPTAASATTAPAAPQAAAPAVNHDAAAAVASADDAACGGQVDRLGARKHTAHHGIPKSAVVGEGVRERGAVD